MHSFLLYWAGHRLKNLLWISLARGNGRKTCYVCPPRRGNSRETCFICPLGGQWQKNLFYMSHGGAMARKQFSHAPASQIGGAMARKQASHAPASQIGGAIARKQAFHAPANRFPEPTAEKFLSLLKILSNSVILDTEKVCKKVRLPWEENQTS